MYERLCVEDPPTSCCARVAGLVSSAFAAFVIVVYLSHNDEEGYLVPRCQYLLRAELFYIRGSRVLYAAGTPVLCFKAAGRWIEAMMSCKKA